MKIILHVINIIFNFITLKNMKNIYSKILLSSLIILTSFMNLFTKNNTKILKAQSMFSCCNRPLKEETQITTTLKLNIFEKIHYIIYYPFLAISIILLLTYTILKIKKKDKKNIHFLLISWIIGILLSQSLSITLSVLKNLNHINKNYQEWLFFYFLSGLLFILFLYFFIKSIIVILSKKQINKDE